MDFLARYFAKLVTRGAIRLPFRDMKPCLLYADDALFFIKPEIQQLQSLQIALTVFQKISGLATNPQKSELLISEPHPHHTTDLSLVLGCNQGSFPFIYLGLPLSNKKLPKTAYLPLIHKLNRRLSGWAAKHLSIAGRLVLLNAVLSALPTYFMMVLRLPKWVIKDIDKIRRRFLWHGVGQHSSKINMANWEMACKPKEYGGLGVADLVSFNKALLMKWCWHWQKPEHRLWKPIFQGTKLTHNLVPISPLFTGALQQCHPFWESATTHIYGKGDRISLWNHNWGYGILKHQLSSLFTHAIDTTITLREASQGAVICLFQQVLTEKAQQELPALTGYLTRVVTHARQDQDNITWNRTDTGIFTVRSAYRAIKNDPHISTNAHRLWKLRVPPRTKVFGWLLVNNKLLTIDNLRRRGWPITNMCVMCRCDAESAHHMVGHCAFARELYQLMDIATEMRAQPIEALMQLENNQTARGTLLVAMFVIWRERCARIFRESQKKPGDLLEEVAQLLHHHVELLGEV